MTVFKFSTFSKTVAVFLMWRKNPDSNVNSWLLVSNTNSLTYYLNLTFSDVEARDGRVWPLALVSSTEARRNGYGPQRGFERGRAEVLGRVE